MSKIETIKIKCLKCEHKFRSDFYTSVNVTLNPELKEKILNGKINEKKCQKCGTFVQIQQAILYHDMKNEILIWIHWLSDEEMNRFSKEEKENSRNILKTRYINDLGDLDFIFNNYRKEVIFGLSELNDKLKEM